VLLWRRGPFRFTERERRRVPSSRPGLPPGPFSHEVRDLADAPDPSPPFPDDAEREAPG
jgi:hypothetical protein